EYCQDSFQPLIGRPLFSVVNSRAFGEKIGEKKGGGRLLTTTTDDRFLVPIDFRILSHHRYTHHFEFVIEPELPRPCLGPQFHLHQILWSSLEVQLLAAYEFHAESSGRMLMGVDGCELCPLLHRTLHRPLVLFAGRPKEFPGQYFTMDEEVIVEDRGGYGQQVRLLMFFLERRDSPLLDQKIVIRQQH